MTSIPLDQIPVTDQARRDRWGRYLVVPPTGGEPVGYTRVTTVAKALDPGGGLAPWKATMTACGMVMRRGLRARWEALLAEHGDPWYAGDDAKRACKELVEDCAAVGGANDRKEMGSALHTMTALVDLGRTPQHLTEETEADLIAYRTCLDLANVTIVPGAVEMTIVLDTYQVAGTFDRLAQVPGFDLPLIADLKTGANLEYSWQAIAVQLAAYSRGEALYQQGAAKDGSADVRHPMPAVNQDWGLVIWLQAGEGICTLYLIDLVQGWEAFGHSMWARGWHKAEPQRPLALPVPTSDADLLQALEASIAAVEGDRRLSPEAEPPPWPGQPAYRDWLQERIEIIGQHGQARQGLLKLWPADTPTLRASSEHTQEQLAAIERLLDDVERRYELPFGPGRPKTEDEVASAVLLAFPGSTVTPTPTDKEPA